MQSSLDRLVIEHFSKRKDVYLPLVPKDRFGNRILSFLRGKPSSKGNFLELGTGSGRLLEYLLRNGLKATVYGVDICRELLKSGKKKYSKEINIILADVRHLPFKEESFHIIASRGLLHHLVGRSTEQNVKSTLKETVRVLKNEGVIFINEGCLKYKVLSRILFMVSYMLARLNIEIPYFKMHARVVVSFLTPNQLYSLLVDSGIKLLEWMEEEWKGGLRYKATLLVTKIIYVRLTASKNCDS